MADQIDGEYQFPDAAKAFEIYDKQIAPKEEKLATIKGDMSHPYSDIKEHANFPRTVLNFIVRLENMEDAKRDHFLLALHEGLKHRDITLPNDLIAQMNGGVAGVIPSGDSDGDGLLVDQPDGDGDDFEASPAELAKQEGRGEKAKEAAPVKSATVTKITPPKKAKSAPAATIQ